jgi:hypothetical protein
MPSVEKPKEYKSPVRKLMRFFEKSRNQWKAKHHQIKRTLKRLQNQVRVLEKRVERWMNRVEELEAEVARMRACGQVLVREVERLKSQEWERRVMPPERAGFAMTPYHHAYSLGQIELFLALVFSAAASLRCAAQVIEIVAARLGLTQPSPSWSTGRVWLLRVGYYKLTRAKVQADDWVWIVDHTVQVGAEKCLVILGIRLCDLPPAGHSLGHADVEPIELLPVAHSDGTVVYQQLEKATAKTGVPRAIVSDHGTDVKAGIEKFCDRHPQTSAVYDIKHKTAAVLKRELEHDPTWLAFTQQASRTQSQLRQTDLAALTPPSQKTKARYMNVDELVNWGQAILTLLDKQPNEIHSTFDLGQVKQKLGWLTQYRPHLATWGELFQVIATTESCVRQQGLYHGAQSDLKKRLRGMAHTEPAQRIRDELVAFVAQEEAKARPHERLLGSSEVIESVLGKMKHLEQHQAKSGFTGLILGLSAMVSTTTHEIIQTALETVPTKKVLAWCQDVLGPTLQAKRRAALSPG